MRKQLRRTFIAAAVLTLLFSILFMAAVVRIDIETDRGSLVAILNTARAWAGEARSSLYDLSRAIGDSSPSLHATFLLPDGTILADSSGVTTGGEALAASGAVRQALTGDIGLGIDWSNPLSPRSFAAASLGQAQLILHLESRNRDILQLLTYALPGFILLVAAIALIARRRLGSIAGKLSHQLRQVGDLLQGRIDREQIDPDAYYPELRPAMQDICRMIDRMRFDLQQIAGARDMQREFVDNSSHELKSPLTSILGFTQMLIQTEGLSPQKQQEYLSYIQRDAKRMLAVIEGILQLRGDEKVDTGSLREISVRSTAREVAHSLAPQCREMGIDINLQGDMQLRINEQDLWDLLRNLMSNAVRYGKSGGHVDVLMEGRTLRVKDDGIGIGEEHLPRIFEKFYRADKTGSRRLGGTGLGLAIVAGIANRYAATIRVNSAVNQGSEFIVHFPQEERSEGSP